MKTVTLVNICGKSHPDLLKGLMDESLQLGANWLSSKVSYLEGYISALIKIEVDNNQQDALKMMFTQSDDITVSFSEAPSDVESRKSLLKLVVDAEDRPGIVNELTRLFNDFGVELLKLNSQSLCAYGLGSTMFTADISLSCPAGLSHSDLITALESLGKDIVVTVSE